MTCSPNGFSVPIRSWIEKIAQVQIPRPYWINLAVGVGMAPAILAGSPAVAADYVRVQFGPIELSISINSLETFVTEGKVEDDLAAYARRLNDERLDEIRQLLVTPADLDAIALSNFLYTRQGEILLERLGNIIRTESNSGFYALRAALILSATSPEGLTPLNVLQEFPTSSIVIDVERALAIVRELERLINTTSEAIALVENQFESNIGSNPPSINPTTDFSDLGPLRWQEQTFNLNDQSRDRSFQVDLYLPNISERVPVIIISHGLGSDRTSFSYLAQHLASYGFAVIAPEHPGSNAEYIQALFTGAATQVADPSEFVDRALDVTYTLDELERRSRAEFQLQGRLDLDNVGVIGQSFGGYTALALAGATINFQQLEQDCPQEDVQEDTLNLSLLLQCRALGLEEPIPTLKDDRVKSVIAINPIGSTVFGKEGFETIDVPIMLVSGSADIVAPTLIEQILPFSWLQVQNKYLLLIQNSTHFSTIGRSSESSETLLLPPEIIGPQPQLAQQYIKAMGVTFFSAFVSDQSQYQAYLTPAHINRISQAPLPLNLVQTINSEQLTRVLKQNELVRSASRQQRSRVRHARFD